MPVNVIADVQSQDYFPTRPAAAANSSSRADDESGPSSFHSALKQATDDDGSDAAKAPPRNEPGDRSTASPERRPVIKNKAADEDRNAPLKRDKPANEDGSDNGVSPSLVALPAQDARPLTFTLPSLLFGVNLQQGIGKSSDLAGTTAGTGDQTVVTDGASAAAGNRTIADAVLTNLFARAGQAAPLTATSTLASSGVAVAKSWTKEAPGKESGSAVDDRSATRQDAATAGQLASVLNNNLSNTSAQESNTLAGVQGAGNVKDPLVLTAPPVKEPAPVELTPKTLAFAVRLTGTENGTVTPAATRAATAGTTGNPQDGQALVGQAFASAAGASSFSGESFSEKQGGQAGSHDGAGTGAYVPAAFSGGHAATTSDATPAASTAAAPASATATLDGTHMNAGTPEPVRNMLLQLRGDDNRRVDIRLTSTGGELRVSVKSADPELAGRLQEHMPELTSRFDTERIGNEIYVPKTGEATRSENNPSQDSANANASQQGGGQQAGNQQRERNPQGQGRPDWVDLLESQIS